MAFDTFEAKLEIAQAATPANAPPQAVGRVDTVIGRVTVEHVDGSQVQAQQGTPIFQGDTITTALDGKVGIVFVDDTRFSIGEKGHMTIDEMIYDPSAHSGKAALSVAEGIFSFVSGQIAKGGSEAMLLTTPVATIGIRGTAGAGKAAPQGSPNTFALLPEAGGFTGEVTIATKLGVVTLNIPFQITQVISPWVPPSSPVVVPGTVVARVFGGATDALPKNSFGGAPVLAPSGNAGGPQTGAAGAGQTGAAGASDTSGPQAPGNSVANAVAQAFNQALSGGGGNLDAALLAAAQVATGAVALGLQTPNGQATNLGTTDLAAQLNALVANATQNALNAVSGLGAQGPGTAGQRSSAEFGTGLGPGIGDNPAAFAHQISEAAQHAIIAKFDPLGFAYFEPPAQLRDAVEKVVVSTVTREEISRGTTSQFDETIKAFTSGNDHLTGTSLNTRFVITQDASPGGFGGTDTVSGGGGTDELALVSLHDFTLVYEAQSTNGGLATYNANGTSGTISMSDIEQIYASDNVENVSGIGSTVSLNTGGNAVRLAFDSSDVNKFGYILAGGTGNDTLSLASGVTLTAVSSATGSTLSASTTFGGLIFGGAGDDTITGSATGDVLFGGPGDDTIRPGGATQFSTSDKDAIFGGAGNDTIIFTSSTTMGTSGAIQAGDGTGDKLQITETGTATYDFSQWGLTGIETLDTSGTTTVRAGNTFLEGLTSVTGSGTTTLQVNGTSLNLSSVTLGSHVTTLTGSPSTVNGGMTIKDNSSDSTGRTLTGGTGADTLTGYGGNDTYNLGSDSARDTVVFSAPGTGAGQNGYDTINNFTSGSGGDKLNFSAFGLTGNSTPTFQAITTDTAISSGSNVFRFSSSLVEIDSSGSVGTQQSALSGSLNMLTAFKGSIAANSIYGFLINDTNGSGATSVWSWNDKTSGGGNGDGVIDSGELHQVATLPSVDVNQIVGDNITG